MINTIKNKYLAQLLAFVVISLIFTTPVLAEEINSDSVIKYVNKARTAEGLSALIPNEKLMKIAQDKLNDMIENKYFAHTSPSGLNPWYWFGKNNYEYQFAGENLAINFLKAEDQQKAWMNSLTHKKNILNVNFAETGVAVGAGEIDGQVSIIAVQEFGTQVGVEPLEGGKSFSVKKDSNLIKDEGKIIPQVLSVKNEKAQTPAAENANGQNVFEYFQSNKQMLADFAEMVSALLLMISLALIPMAFIGVAGGKLLSLYEEKKKQQQDVKI